MPRHRVGMILTIVVFIFCVAFQLFVRPSIGLANNGDFAKLVGRFSLGPASLDSSEESKYFTSRWVYKSEYQWVSDNQSSELILISAAVLIGWGFSSYVFDIRILGAIHALLWTGCFAALLSLFTRLKGWKAFVPALAALFIFTDVSYVAYFNSFYRDTAAFLFLSWAVVLWLHITLSDRRSTSLYVIFCIASILCVGSQPQHAVLGPFLFALAVLAAIDFKGKWRKSGAFALALAILVGGIGSYLRVVDADRLQPHYSVIFHKILKRSTNQLEDLRELGLGPQYVRYVGYEPQSGAYDPKADAAWRTKFLEATNNGRIARFHLRHPWRALAIVYDDLHNAAQNRRPPFLGNYERRYAHERGTRARSFGWWSSLRSALFHFVPWHILVWYAAVIGTGVRFAIRGRNGINRRIPMLCVLLACMGLVELLTSSLADSGETDRHLFLFHVITDFTILLAVVWMVVRWNPMAAPASGTVPETERRHAAGQTLAPS